MLEMEYEQMELLTESEAADLGLVQQICEYALGKSNWSESSYEVSIVFMSDVEIQAINLQYRSKDTPTDVISFAFEDVEDTIVYEQGMTRLLGEIYISIDATRRQAEQYGHSFKREVNFLLLHGFLHLLGYDHLDTYAEKEMFQLQNEILNHFDLVR